MHHVSRVNGVSIGSQWRCLACLAARRAKPTQLDSTTSDLEFGNKQTSWDQGPICSLSIRESALLVRDKCMHLCTQKAGLSGIMQLNCAYAT